MKIRITTIRQLPGWDLKLYCTDMAKQGVPMRRVDQFFRTGKTSIVFGKPDSATYNITTYEILDETAPVRSLDDERHKSEDDKKVGGCEKCRSCGEEKTDTRSGSKEAVLPDSKTY